MNDYVSMVIILLLLNHYILEKGVGKPPPLKKTYKEGDGFERKWGEIYWDAFPFHCQGTYFNQDRT